MSTGETKTEKVQQTFVKRVTYSYSASADELHAGVVFPLANNAKEVFGPDCERAIVLNVSTTNFTSNCNEPVTVALNLGNASITNTVPPNNHGSLWSQCVTDLDADHVATSRGGFQNVLNILPFETYRGSAIGCFSPAADMDNRKIKEYSHYTLDTLWDGIVKFEGQDYYYVDENSVVTSVLAKNWESLGMNPAAEERHEDKYIKVGADVVDSCISQLYNNVISKIDYTNLNSLRVRMQSNNEEGGSNMYKVCGEFNVEYKIV